jgi:hypothetical protein
MKIKVLEQDISVEYCDGGNGAIAPAEVVYPWYEFEAIIEPEDLMEMVDDLDDGYDFEDVSVSYDKGRLRIVISVFGHKVIDSIGAEYE